MGEDMSVGELRDQAAADVGVERRQLQRQELGAEPLEHAARLLEGVLGGEPTAGFQQRQTSA